VYLNILGSFLKLEKVHSPPHNFFQKKGGKNIPFLDENIPYLEDGRGGGGGG
jgi:hypothetical protein